MSPLILLVSPGNISFMKSFSEKKKKKKISAQLQVFRYCFSSHKLLGLSNQTVALASLLLLRVLPLLDQLDIPLGKGDCAAGFHFQPRLTNVSYPFDLFSRSLS